MDRTIDNRQWQRSSYCGSGACVEVASAGRTFFVRDSKEPTGPVLAFTTGQGAAFLTAVKKGTLR